MKALNTLFLLAGLTATAQQSFASESKPLATQAAEAIQPYAKKFGEAVDQTVHGFFAGTDGPLGDAARSNLQSRQQAEREANRGTRKPMKECIKPGNVIDDDVKECMEGLREKSW
ncbi:hypothetical protein [Metapseudomonas resinovorans]|uniref:Uncharacterized protein n=1 Tax=Metapseudomonas resinovorans NBRC 106553 TaxID=1245471 RepID=S6BNH4_METRE|nr:hypothetical protein [Pseudomonas resinovorans]BAN50574.1 hypothetical protein PCA10_48420 [Pseudomonas resinovorans NBRC 106553]